MGIGIGVWHGHRALGRPDWSKFEGRTGWGGGRTPASELAAKHSHNEGLDDDDVVDLKSWPQPSQNVGFSLVWFALVWGRR